jgi:RalA-binding protein 1
MKVYVLFFIELVSCVLNCFLPQRGGTHLGSITITGAQIGRQQRTGDRRESDDEKEYRHAFLIIEAKKAPSGSGARHVLCAESDADRDNWVEVLVRYIMGSYNDDPAPTYVSSVASSVQQSSISIHTTGTSSSTQTAGSSATRSSTSSNTASSGTAHENPVLSPSTTRRAKRNVSRDDTTQGLPQLGADGNPMRPFPSHEELIDPSPDDAPLSSSLPTTSPLDAASTSLVGASNQRANSEMGHYPDLQEPRDGGQGHGSPERHRHRGDQYRGRKLFHPTLNTVASIPNTPKPGDQESVDTPRADGPAKAKISGPLGGTVIPAGYKFGGPPESGPSAADRREKAKSRSFWGFGKNGAL